MCGIAGFSIKNINQNEVENVCSSFYKLQEHRGPDFTGTWSDDKNFFFHHRLALIDGSSHANQPFKNDNYVLCFNGEIYNFRQLKNQLPFIDFVSTSDTEVLFHYLIHFGVEKTLQDIKGMFAFSFFDIKKKEIILARDRFGIKPLYYLNNNNVFAFASEVRTLAKTFHIKPDSYKTIMALNSIAEGSSTYTLFDGIYNVKPGTYLIVNSDFKISEHYYYKLVDQVDVNYYNELKGLSKKAVVDKFENLMLTSVEEMLVSDFPMGAFVSGGIDSSIISAMAKKILPDFSLFTADIVGKHSEYKDALALANHLSLDIKKTDFHPDDFLKYWLQKTDHNSAPIVYFTNALPIARVAELANTNNIKAVLCGEGSDELFLGYSRLIAQRYKKGLLFPNELLKKAYKIYPSLYNYLFQSEYNNLDAFNIRLANGFKSEMLYEEGKEVYNFVPKSQLKYYVDSFEMSQKHLQALLYRNDRMGMISSIEVRFPFLHEDVVKFAVNLPLEYKTRRSFKVHNKKHPFLIDKWIVREISKKYLPEQLVNKRKNGLPIDGLNGVKFSKEFFKDGYLADKIQLDSKSLAYLIKNENPYFIGKLASIEVFGLLYDFNLSHDDILSKITNYSTMSR